jgi:hypothetical protein
MVPSPGRRWISYSPVLSDFYRQVLPLKSLFAGMTLEEDVMSETSGLIIFRKETILTETWIERLENFAKSQGIKEPLRVRVPGLAAAPVFRTSSVAANPNSQGKLP